MRPSEQPEPTPAVDLHGLNPEGALRALARALHAARVRRSPALLVITGRGHGNRLQAPVLRTRIEGWLAGAEAKSLGVLGWKRVHREGALELRLAAPRAAPGDAR